MALVRCLDCGKSVSSTAPACPNCGRPVRAQTIEKTSKSLKGRLLFFGLMFWIGVVLGVGACTVSSNDPNADVMGTAMVGMGLILAGLLGVLFTKLLIWWRHE